MDSQVKDASLFDRPDQSRRSEAVGWLLMVALALVLFELTAEPSLAIALGCLKFGGPDLRVARWLRQADPDPVRGRACSWFYVTMAIARIGFMAFFLLFVLFAATGAGMPKAKLEHQAIGALLVLLACYVAAAVASWIAVLSALRAGLRVWMDRSAGFAARARIWPPFLPERSGRSALGPGLVIFYAALSAWLAVLAGLVIAVGGLFGRGTLSVFLGLVFVTLGAILGLRLTPRVSRRIEAASPWQCYPESPVRVPADFG
jgi:hypothetical protein